MKKNKKNKYADVNKSVSRDVKYKISNVCKKVEKILKDKSIDNWKIIVAGVVIIVFLCMSLANNKKEKMDITKYPKNSFDGNGFLTAVYPIFNDVVIIGDSYSHFLALDVGFDVKIYARPGLKLSQLEEVFNSASLTKEKYAVIYIGPNDLVVQTEKDIYKGLLQKYVRQLKEKNKKVFIVTYFSSEFTEEAKKKFENGITVDDYDELIQEVCMEEDATYIDAKDINDYHNNKRIECDGMVDPLHFNQEFNVKLINRIYEYLYDMLSKEK